ncbi:hypothetical protein FRC04_009776 [Tulasnella sp. 424]|nr:hypothetical protein FRC04_009776 [Tulasnella sp. 424]KAG8971146.1 hypothetical protein FRC05_011430 [Tulasnella sp. 425]
MAHNHGLAVARDLHGGLRTLRLLDPIRTVGFEKFVRFYQASELYGKVVETPQSETTPLYRRSPYGVAKLYAYWITVNYREAYGMYACNGILFSHESQVVAEIKPGKQSCLYLSNLNAKRDWGHDKDVIDCIIKDVSDCIPTETDIRRSTLPAADYVEGMWRMLQQEQSEDFVFATGETPPVRDFVERSFAVVGITVKYHVSHSRSGKDAETGPVIVRVDPKYFRPTEVEFLHGNPAKAEKKLG